MNTAIKSGAAREWWERIKRKRKRATERDQRCGKRRHRFRWAGQLSGKVQPGRTEIGTMIRLDLQALVRSASEFISEEGRRSSLNLLKGFSTTQPTLSYPFWARSRSRHRRLGRPPVVVVWSRGPEALS